MRTDYRHPSSPRSGGPLAGIRVIEAGVLFAEPFSARWLADFGAEVIKTEAPGEGDPMRTTGQALVDGTSLLGEALAGMFAALGALKEIYGTVLGLRAGETGALAVRGVL